MISQSLQRGWIVNSCGAYVRFFVFFSCMSTVDLGSSQPPTARSLLLMKVVPEMFRSFTKIFLTSRVAVDPETMFLHVIFPSLTQPFSIIGVLQRS
jgi:hypothetical protein